MLLSTQLSSNGPIRGGPGKDLSTSYTNSPERENWTTSIDASLPQKKQNCELQFPRRNWLNSGSESGDKWCCHRVSKYKNGRHYVADNALVLRPVGRSIHEITNAEIRRLDSVWPVIHSKLVSQEFPKMPQALPLNVRKPWAVWGINTH